MFLFAPHACFFWEGEWGPHIVEPSRRLYETELVYLSHGVYDLLIEDRRHTLRPGAVALIPPGVWHESRSGRRGHVVRHCIHFEWTPHPARPARPLQAFVGEPYDTALVSPAPPDIAPRLPLVVQWPRGSEVLRVLEQALSGLRRGDPIGEHLLWPVLTALLQPTSAPGAVHPSYRSAAALAALQVRDYIDRHYREPHGYEVYTELTGLSAAGLCRAFRRLVGRTPTAYLIDLRLSQAYRHLQEGTLAVKEVAHHVGVSDANYFARLFRRRFGLTPSEVAAQARAGG
jgi:AraC-like DNA-binding protein